MAYKKKEKAAATIGAPSKPKATIKNKAYDPANQTVSFPVLVETPDGPNTQNPTINERFLKNGNTSEGAEGAEDTETASENVSETEDEGTESQVGITWVGEPGLEIFTDPTGQIVNPEIIVVRPDPPPGYDVFAQRFLDHERTVPRDQNLPSTHNPALVGEVMTPFSERFTVKLRYSGESPLRAVAGPFPSGAKYRIANGQLIAFGVDVDQLLENSDFSEI